MLEKALAKKSPKVIKAQKKVSSVESAILRGKSVRGKDLVEFKENNRLLGRWNWLIAKAEISAGVCLLASGAAVKNKKLKVLLGGIGALAVVDAGGNFLQNRGREFLGDAIEGEKTVSQKSLKRIIRKRIS